MKTYYVISYGGCGSKLLCNALKKYGKVEHIHSRNPPDELEYVGGKHTYKEWFNGIKIPKEELDNYIVIYLYKNPVKAIFSRFYIRKHLINIQLENIDTTIVDVCKSKKDLFKIKEFYNNYMTKNSNRNYKILGIKYEELFDKQDLLSNFLNIGPLNLVKHETKRFNPEKINKRLNKIYNKLILKMEKNDFITIN